MKLQTVEARQGARWLKQGFRTFFGHPMAFAALFASFMFVAFLFMLLPFVGVLLVLALLPLMSLGFMIATRVAIDGGVPTLRVFIDPLRADRPRVKAMLQLGLIYVVATLAVIWLSDLADGGALEALMESLPAGQTSPQVMADKLNNASLLLGLLLRFGLAGLLSVPFWHAPALVYWEGHGCAKALFSSTLACWRNRGAFTVYGLSWVAVITLVGIVGGQVFALLGQSQAFAVALVPLSLLLTTVFYVSLYFTFADCFKAGESELIADAA